MQRSPGEVRTRAHTHSRTHTHTHTNTHAHTNTHIHTHTLTHTHAHTQTRTHTQTHTYTHTHTHAHALTPSHTPACMQPRARAHTHTHKHTYTHTHTHTRTHTHTHTRAVRRCRGAGSSASRPSSSETISLATRLGRCWREGGRNGVLGGTWVLRVLRGTPAGTNASNAPPTAARRTICRALPTRRPHSATLRATTRRFDSKRHRGRCSRGSFASRTGSVAPRNCDGGGDIQWARWALFIHESRQELRRGFTHGAVPSTSARPPRRPPGGLPCARARALPGVPRLGAAAGPGVVTWRRRHCRPRTLLVARGGAGRPPLNRQGPLASEYPLLARRGGPLRTTPRNNNPPRGPGRPPPRAGAAGGAGGDAGGDTPPPPFGPAGRKPPTGQPRGRTVTLTTRIVGTGRRAGAS
jgi:hypothetical protein